MNTDRKEGWIKELRFKEIESFDKDSTQLMFKTMAVFFATVVFFYNLGVFRAEYFKTSFSFFIFSFFAITWFLEQQNRHVRDCYESLFNAIKNDKLLEYRLPWIKPYEIFYYKMKHH